jgi:hypothetical protein
LKERRDELDGEKLDTTFRRRDFFPNETTMQNTNPIEEAMKLFTKPAPPSYADQQRAILENMQRLRRERLEREAGAKAS